MVFLTGFKVDMAAFSSTHRAITYLPIIGQFFFGVASTKSETSMIYVGLTLLSFNPCLFTFKIVLDTA